MRIAGLFARAAGVALAIACAVSRGDAQDVTASLAGVVSDSARTPLAGVTLHLNGTRLGAMTDSTGAYRVEGIAPGNYTVLVRRPGALADTFAVAIPAVRALRHDFVLGAHAARLASVTISASARLNETKEQALDKQRNADNIVTVISGDEIRSLPNANAAEAIARIPGVSTERDEGEGKFIQIRGTEPRLSNVTINGGHVPGTTSGDRIAKLDDVPTDILGAIEVSKTLTADMDADAIGGSVNLVTKTPEGAPRGYIAGQFGQSTILDRTQGQGSLMWGGRFGDDRRLGFLIGGTYDHNNRSINDLELGWNTDDAGRVTPGEWDQRDYAYNRSRYGIAGDIDYRFADGSTMYLKGMWSLFDNFGLRYRYDLAAGGDSLGSGNAGIGTGSALTRESSNRTPSERMYGFNLGGKKLSGTSEFSYAANYTGTTARSSNYRTTDFTYAGPGSDAFNVRYDGTNRNAPAYSYVNLADANAANTPANFVLSRYTLGDGTSTGRDVGGAIDELIRYSLGTAPAQFKIGAKYRAEDKQSTSLAATYNATGSFLLSQAQGSFSDPNFYKDLASGFVLGPVPNNETVSAYENANPAQFTNATNVAKNALGSFSGGEKVAAAYIMNSADFGPMHVNVGLRMENTAVNFTGSVATTPGDSAGHKTGPAVLSPVTGSQNYTDLFPSLQLRYAVDDRSNVRFAVTRAIARANYSDLSPHLSGEECAACKFNFGNLSAGNPDLRPQHAWNFDLLGERYISSSGIFSAGVFYKEITDFIYRRQFVYSGPISDFTGYYGTEPANGGSGTVLGTEFDYTQRLEFLPGAWSGLGFDVNWTHSDSRAAILGDTATSGTHLGQPVVMRYAPFPRQAKNIGNVALTYDSRLISARAAWQYQGESIYSYGDGSATPSGDSWFFPHSQIDASVIVNVTATISVQLEGLDLNNAVFGFYNGTPGQHWANQREYYGRSAILAIKYGFGAAPGQR
jgi:TonB-dependent receptor